MSARRPKSNIHPRWAALRFKLTTTKRRVFQSRCSRCRRLHAHAKGRRVRVRGCHGYESLVVVGRDGARFVVSMYVLLRKLD